MLVLFRSWIGFIANTKVRPIYVYYKNVYLYDMSGTSFGCRGEKAVIGLPITFTI